MGSYLTVVNDTPDDWVCKVGPDRERLVILAIVLGVAALIGSVIVPGPALVVASVSAGLGITAAHNVPASKLMVRTAKVAIGSVPAGTTVSDFGIEVRNSIIKTLLGKKYNYDMIKAGERKRYGKMTLSLWQQSECIKPVINGVNVTVHSLYMRPIFSGRTDKSNRDYSISSYLTKYGTKQETIQGRSDPPPADTKNPSDSK